MLWKRKTKSIVVPPFSAIEKPLYPVVYQAYGHLPSTPRLTHTFTIKRLPTGVSPLRNPSKLLTHKILDEERRYEDRTHWQRFLLAPPNHSLRFSYTIDSEPDSRPRELMHAWVNFAIPGWDTSTIAIECGDFMVWSANDLQLPGVLTVRSVNNASLWLIFAYTRLRSIYVKAGIATERSRSDTVSGYRLTGDG